METATRTMNDFMKDNSIRMSAQRVGSNPNMEDTGIGMDHYKCTLLAGRSKMTVYFSKGYGHNGIFPKADEVLDCLASDCSTANYSFEDWCSDLGYNIDSRKAEKTYHTIQKQAASLKRLLGDSAFDALLYHTERL